MSVARGHRPLGVAAVAVTAVMFVASAAASAAAPWSAPVALSAVHGAIGPLGLTSTDTSTVAWWGWQDGFGGDAKFGDAFAARPAGVDVFDPERLRAFGEPISLDVQGYGL